MIDERHMTTVHYVADSVIQFVCSETPERTYRFIKIQKWDNSQSIDRNIYFNVENNEIVVDIRARVI